MNLESGPQTRYQQDAASKLNDGVNRPEHVRKREVQSLPKAHDTGNMRHLSPTGENEQDAQSDPQTEECEITIARGRFIHGVSLTPLRPSAPVKGHGYDVVPQRARLVAWWGG
jgi:hypothetical protein